jgi:drug/metabolite transporter (DMT)-like permease
MISALLPRLAPPLFVLIWATGFVMARLVAPHADPLTFLICRYALAALVLGAVALAAGAPWPRDAAGWRDALVAGVLLHGGYLGGVFWAVKHGLPAGVAALVVGLQPLATACLVGPLLGERVGLRRWAGILVGFLGAALVLLPRLGAAGYAGPALAAAFGAMLSITLGTIWQKRVAAGFDMRAGTTIQYLGAAAVTVPVALATERGFIDPAPAFWLGLAWAVLGLSIGAILLLLLLIRRGAVAGVAALFYLTPGVAALLAFALFDERLAPVQILGMAVTMVGVALAGRSR